jgi:hypothetical protein
MTTLLSSTTSPATESSAQFIGKLTYLVHPDHRLTLTVIGTPSQSGGRGAYSFGAQTNAPPTQLNGTYGALATEVVNDAFDGSLKYEGAFDQKRELLDVTLGYHHQHQATRAADGTGPDQTTQAGTLAGTPQVDYRATTPTVHSITDFERVPGAASACRTVSTASGPTPTCPVTTYASGGPAFMDDLLLDSVQARAMFTALRELLGHHIIKAGVDVHFDAYRHDKAYSGTVQYVEGSAQGSGFADLRQYGFLAGPDAPVLLPHWVSRTTTISAGGFLQDSWQLLDKVTINVGLRYDAQLLYGADGALALSLPNQWSPRVGVVYDFTHQGRSKVFASYARYYEGVPLDIADRSFPSESQVSTNHPSCTNPLDPSQRRPGGPCSASAPHALPPNTSSNPSQRWTHIGGGKEAVDPSLSPQSSDEFVVGAEYEVFADARLGVTYTHRQLHRAIEDMSRDEANTYFIGNPGYGIASDFPKAQRDYDAVTIAFTKTYGNLWLLTASYTASRLWGNYAGLFRPETGQLDPNMTSAFDLKSLLPNQTGPLPGDHTHQIKVFAAKDFELPGGQSILVGLAYRGLSGSPLNALGAHPIYGQDESFVLPRGWGGTLAADGVSVSPSRAPWQHDIDLRLGYTAKLGKASALAITLDVFNLFDFQAPTLLDPSYTFRSVQPCSSGTVPTCVRPSDGGGRFTKADVNPNYGKPLAYQDPRQFRIGARVTF